MIGAPLGSGSRHVPVGGVSHRSMSTISSVAMHLFRIAQEAVSNADREREVFSLIGRGLAPRDIARQLNRSVKTIETRQARIKGKLGLTTCNELIRAVVTREKL